MIYIYHGYNQYVVGGTWSFDMIIEKNSSDAIEKNEKICNIVLNLLL